MFNIIGTTKYCIVYQHTSLEGKKSSEQYLKNCDGEILFVTKKEYLVEEIEQLKEHVSMEDPELRYCQKADGHIDYTVCSVEIKPI